jgi:hypothetical protein
MRAKPGLNAFGMRLMEILSQIERDAGTANIGRRRLAQRLGVSEHTMAAWFKPSRTSMIPSDRLFELACREDLLPKPARDALWANLGREGGYIVVPEMEAGPNGVSPLVHLAGIAAALGVLAATVRKESGNGNGNGESNGISPAQAKKMLEQVFLLTHATTQMRAALEELHVE